MDNAQHAKWLMEESQKHVLGTAAAQELMFKAQWHLTMEQVKIHRDLVAATEASVKQQRISNLIAYRQSTMADLSRLDDKISVGLSTNRPALVEKHGLIRGKLEELSKEINEGLMGE